MNYIHKTKSDWADGAALYVANNSKVKFEDDDTLTIVGNSENDYNISITDDGTVTLSPIYFTESHTEYISVWDGKTVTIEQL